MKTISVILFLAAASAPLCLNAKSPSPKEVYLQTAQEIRQLHRDLGVDSVLINLQNSITQINQEVMIAQGGHSSGSSWGNASSKSSLESSFYSRRRWYAMEQSGRQSSSSAQGSRYHSSDWDMTKFIVQNAEELEQFDQDMLNAYHGMQRDLLEYLENNVGKIVRLKELGVLNLAAAYELLRSGNKVPRQELQSTASLLGHLNFIGANNITSCVQTNYIDRESKRSDSSSYAYGGNRGRSYYYESPYESESLERSRSWSGYSRQSWQSYRRQFAHSEIGCYSTINQVEVLAEQSTYEINLSQLDTMIMDWLKAIDVLRIQTEKARNYPTFGSPYFD